MNYKDVFVKNDDSYKKDINPIRHYVDQAALYLSRQTGDTIEQCKTWVLAKINSKTITAKPTPVITYYERNELGDREKKQCTIIKYVYSAVKDGLILAPTMTAYIAPTKRKSLLAMYIEVNIMRRAQAKKAQFKAKAEKNDFLAASKNVEQTGKKLANNAVSGGHCVASTPIYNRTAHSTLTSNCRTITSHANANTEKILSGNRHYWRFDVCVNNIISIANNTDYDKLSAVMAKYKLHIPTVAETMECIKWSTDLYWHNKYHTDIIYETVSKMQDLERAAFVYTSDMHHLKKHNGYVIMDLLDKLSTRITDVTINEPLAVIKKVPESIMNLTHQVCTPETKGIGKDYSKLSPVNLNTVAATAVGIQNSLTLYQDLIECFFVSNNLPPSIAYIKQSIRRNVVTSDTDSTIFSVQDWPIWFTNSDTRSEKSGAVAAATIFIVSSTITHILSLLSANIGFAKEHLHTMQMKSEFFWPVFVNTSVAKHYFALCAVQEGNVYDEYEREVKGVHLVSSNMPPLVKVHSKTMMDKIMHDVLDNKKISIYEVLKTVADIEREIIDSLLKGKVAFYRSGKIKDPESYGEGPERSPYQHHTLWMDVFSPKYGDIPAPTYNTIKIPTIVANVTELNRWLESIQDLELRNRLGNWLCNKGKDSLPTMYINTDFINANGIPEEIKGVIAVRRIVGDLCGVFYILLEALGYYVKEGAIISDTY